MKIGVAGIGIWAAGIGSWPDFEAGLKAGFSLPEQFSAPAPQSIPARERRRAPQTVKLAVEVIDQVAAMAGADQKTLCSVFCSAMGDSHITDYMCRTLAGPDKSLSPTRFHNSVHNTTSGYWSIAAGNRLPSTFVSGFRASFATGLLEAAALAHAERTPTLLVAYDVAFGQPLYDISPADEDCAVALLINSVNPGAEPSRWQLDLSLQPGACVLPAAINAYVQERVESNPAAVGLLLCEMLASQKPADRAAELRLPLHAARNHLRLGLNQ